MTYTRTLSGTAGNNVLTGDSRNEQINGLGGNDFLSGNGGSDRLDGGTGNDNLNGGDGDDILIGGSGTDLLTGGAGADVFVVSSGGGADTVSDFVVGTDLIDLTAFGAYSSIVQSGSDTLITLSGGETLRLQGVSAGTVTDFSFLGLPASLPSSSPLPATYDRTVNGSATKDALVGDAGNDQTNQPAGGAAIDANALAAGVQGFTLVDVFTGAAGQPRLARDEPVSEAPHLLQLEGAGRADYEPGFAESPAGRIVDIGCGERDVGWLL